MTITSLDAVFYTLAFVVPGFVGYSVFSVLVPGRATDASLLRFFTFSCYNYALWAAPVYWAISRDIPRNWSTGAAIAWGLAVILVSPALLGLLLGVLSQQAVARRVLERVGIATIHPIPTAWDYFFSTTKPTWVLVTLSDGQVLGGYFGPRSFASSEPKERDLYLEESYRVESGVWSRDSRDGGAWISAAEIKRIDIWNEEESTNG